MNGDFKEYKHNNQRLFKDSDGKIKLQSYSTIVLVVDYKGNIELDEYSKISTTTSKHITQAKSFLAQKGFI